MTVELLHATPLWVASRAIRTCWDSHDKSDTLSARTNLVGCTREENDLVKDIYELRYVCGPKDKELVQRIGNKMKHESVKNHVHYTFAIQGITTKTLLALTRHDVGTEFSVQSTRYTTKKSVKKGTCDYTESKSDKVNNYLREIEKFVIDCVNSNEPNDEISLLLPQSWKYNLVCTMSMTALQHFVALRTKKDAHWDIQDLANTMYEAIPKEHAYLFEDYITKDTDGKSG